MMSREMTNSEAISNLNHIYGIVSPDIQRSLDVAIEALEQQLKCGCNTCEYYPMKDQRPQGEWIKDNSGDRFCSVCGKSALYHEIGLIFESRFCPNCGAYMRGKEE